MTALGLLAWVAAGMGDVAFACGGTVCGNGSTTSGTTSTDSGQVVQTGETIVFVQDADDAWTALVQIQTAGAPTGFGWVVPVPNPVDPAEVTIADEGLMDDLEQATAPQFQVDGAPVSTQGGSAAGCGAGCTAPSLGTLVQQGASELLDAVDLPGVAVVGPYEVASVGPEQLDLLELWFDEGGYALPRDTWPIVDAYAAEGYSFLILRLLPLQGQGQGTVDTIRIPCGQAEPAIPLRLTSIASIPDLAITTYVVANHRYAPAADWPEVAFDPRSVDPADPAGDYVVQLQGALDQAGGRGFRTEFAGWLSDLDLAPATRDALGDGAYVTRLRSWASPADMVSDPAFVLVPSAGDVSNVIDLRSGTTSRAALVLAPLLVALSALIRRRR